MPTVYARSSTSSTCVYLSSVTCSVVVAHQPATVSSPAVPVAVPSRLSCRGQRNVMIGVRNNEVVYVPLSEAIRSDKPFDRKLIKVLDGLSI